MRPYSQHNVIHGNTEHNSNFSIPQVICTQRLKSGAVVNIGQRNIEVELALQHPTLLHTLQKMVTAAVSLSSAKLPKNSSTVPSLQQVDVSNPSPLIRPQGSGC
jgi:hypothetical protein